MRAWHRSHQAAKFSPPHVCVSLKHDVRLSLLKQALCTAVPPSRQISQNILRFDQPMDTSQTSHSIRQSHSNFSVAIKRSAWSRGLAVGLTDTSCCGVCNAQPHRKGEGCQLPLTASQQVRGEVFVKREEVWRNAFSIWRSVLRKDIWECEKSQPIHSLCKVRPL